jgi:UDP-glucose-4-epimerase GalE
VKVLVTGGAGYVGSFTVRHLLECGHEVVVLDNLTEGHRGAVPSEILVVGEVADRAAVERLLGERQIEAVMHFAGSTSVAESVRNPAAYYRNNVATTLALLEAMVANRVRRLVFSSTAATYGEPLASPIEEDCPQQPTNPYGFTKLIIERMILDFSRAYGLGHVLLRYFNASGASVDGSHGEDHDPETHLIPLVFRAVAEGRELEVFGGDYPTPDGTCIRDYVHVEDLARAHELALRACASPGDEPQGRAYNIGTGKGHSVLEVLQAVEQVTGRPVRYCVTPRRPGDPPELVASSRRLRHELGWKPVHEQLETVVETASAWHRTHPEGYGS